eukprot:COSAG06_NODE_2379_length_6982_cov_7.713035_11_plen_105_part_00
MHVRSKHSRRVAALALGCCSVARCSRRRAAACLTAVTVPGPAQFDHSTSRRDQLRQRPAAGLPLLQQRSVLGACFRILMAYGLGPYAADVPARLFVRWCAKSTP